jgi:hypothetical protein
MPMRIVNSRITPLVLVTITILYGVGIVFYRMFVHPTAGRIGGPIALALFVLAYYLISRNMKDDHADPEAMKAEIERLREELRASRREGLK